MNVSRQRAKRRKKSGLFAGLASGIQKYPALSGGATAFAVVMSLISANAVWYQPDQHPAPIFSTRADAGVNDGAAHRKTRRITTSSIKSHTNRRLDIAHAKPQVSELTKELQIALAEKNIYSGSIDGIYGTRTKNAIVAYQEKNNLNADGKVSAKLLSHVLMSGKAIARIPVPTHNVAFSGSQKTDASNTKSKKLVSEIQAGLKNYGYEDIVIDGVMGNQTSNAIRRFELDYGLQITGEASSSLLKKLKDIGATGRG